MSIPDKAVEAAQAIWNVPPIRDGRCSWEYWNENNPAGPEKLRKQARAALEAAEPYLTDRESGLRQALEKHLAFMDGSPTVSVESIRRILAAHPEVES